MENSHEDQLMFDVRSLFEADFEQDTRAAPPGRARFKHIQTSTLTVQL